mgnify:CR=1 FL=1
MRRHEQREHIFKLLFMTQFNEEGEMPEQLSLYFDSLEELTEEEQAVMKKKYDDILAHIEEIDQELNEYSQGWKTSRMNRVDLTALRLAFYEMKFDEEIPVGVAINEAVELAKLFGGEDSGSFVNGILGKIANPDKKVAARKASSKKEEQTSARPKSGFKVKDPSKKVVVVNRNVSSRAPENKNE